MPITEPSLEGLRERKKRRTRLAISDVATRLFEAHGFEEVTLAQIAAAAEVSVKTIFNHFGSKEDLYFDRAQELRDSLARALTDRGPGETALGAVHALLRENLIPFPGHPWAGLADPASYERLRGFMAVQDRSAALRAHRLVLEEELGGFLLAALSAELDRSADDPDLRALAVMVIAALQLRERTLREAIMSRLPAEEVRRRVQAVAGAAFARLAIAFADLDPPR